MTALNMYFLRGRENTTFFLAEIFYGHFLLSFSFPLLELNDLRNFLFFYWIFWRKNFLHGDFLRREKFFWGNFLHGDFAAKLVDGTVRPIRRHCRRGDIGGRLRREGSGEGSHREGVWICIHLIFIKYTVKLTKLNLLN